MVLNIDKKKKAVKKANKLTNPVKSFNCTSDIGTIITSDGYIIYLN